MKEDGYLEYISKQLAKFKTVLLLLGNHEPYHSSWESVKQKFRDLKVKARANQKDKGFGTFIFLEQTRYDISLDTTILGFSFGYIIILYFFSKVYCLGTLHSNILPFQSETVSFGLDDFYHIEDGTVEQHVESHCADLDWLNFQVKSIVELELHRKIIIFTHHSPAISPSRRQYHAHSKLSSGFVADLSSEDCWTDDNVKIWAFGHTNFNCDFIDKVSGKRVVTNRRGYYSCQSAGFDERKSIDI